MSETRSPMLCSKAMSASIRPLITLALESFSWTQQASCSRLIPHFVSFLAAKNARLSTSTLMRLATLMRLRTLTHQTTSNKANCASGEAEKQLRRPDGSYIWVLQTRSVVRSASGIALYFIVQTQNITRRRVAEQSLRESEALYRALAKSIPNGTMMLFDKNLCQIETYAERDSASLTDPTKKNMSISDAFAPQEREVLTPLYKTAIEGEPASLELEIDGRFYDVHVHPVKGNQGEVLCGMVMTHDISMRLKSEQAARAALHDKEVLLKEIHHRVKNNLQVISSLLSLQAQKTASEPMQEALAESQNRIQAIARFHESLYRSRDLAAVDAIDYLKDLVAGICRTFCTGGAYVDYAVTGDAIAFNADIAVACGLIINELVSNSFKHAFRGRQRGTVGVTLSRLEGDNVQLYICDDGIGLPADFSALKNLSLGMQLVESLVDQLEGSIRMGHENGSQFTILFSLRPMAALLVDSDLSLNDRRRGPRV